MKIRNLLVVAVVALCSKVFASIEPYTGIDPYTGAGTGPYSGPFKFSCEFLKMYGDSVSDPGNPIRIPYTPDRIIVSFLPNGQLESAVRSLSIPLKAVTRIAITPQNSKFQFVQGAPGGWGKYATFTVDLGGGLSSTIAYPVADYYGRQFTPLKSLVAIEYGYGAGQHGRLFWIDQNSNFQQGGFTLRTVFSCHPI